MKDAELGLFQMVVVKDISRFARNTVDLLSSTRKLKSLNIETLFITSNMTVLGNSEFVLTLYGALAQEESQNISKRIKFSKKLNAEKGRVPNIVYGYDKKAGDYFHLSVNRNEADVVKRIFQLYVFEGMGQAAIAALLNREGIVTKRLCSWSQNAVARILKNPLYTGKVINGKQEVQDFLTGVRVKKDEADWLVKEQPDLAIVDACTFEKAQRLLVSRGPAFKLNKERQSSRHIFSTLIKCKCCGHSFRRTVRTYRNTYVNWVCGGRSANGAGSCPNRTPVDESALLEAVGEYLIPVLQKPGIARNVELELKRLLKRKNRNQDRKQELQAKVLKLKRDRQKYIDMNLNEIIGLDELKDKLAAIRREMERTENELRLTGYGQEEEELRGRLDAIFRNTCAIVPVDEMTNAMMKRMIQKIEVDQNGSVDVYLNLFYEAEPEQTVTL